MNRRNFITGSSLALAAGGGMAPRKLFATAPGLNTAVYTACTAAHAIAAGNYQCGTPTSADWNTVGNTLENVITDWTANNMDSALQSSYAQVTTAQLSSSNLNKSAILAQMQLYQPSFTMTDVNNLVAFLDAQSTSSKQTILTNLVQSGLTPSLVTLRLQSRVIADSIGAGGGEPEGFRTTDLTPSSLRGGLTPFMGPHGGGGSSRCQVDGAALFIAASTFAVIAVMAAVPGMFLLAGWGMVALCGGTATATWGAGHVIMCNF